MTRQFGDRSPMPKRPRQMSPPPVLDSTDLRILTALQDDASLTNVELAEKVGLSPSPCLTRVRSLEASGIIARRVALLDSSRFGGSISVFIQVTLEKQTEPALEIFEASIGRLP